LKVEDDMPLLFSRVRKASKVSDDIKGFIYSLEKCNDDKQFIDLIICELHNLGNILNSDITLISISELYHNIFINDTSNRIFGPRGYSYCGDNVFFCENKDISPLHVYLCFIFIKSNLIYFNGILNWVIPTPRLTDIIFKIDVTSNE